jgi:hypothetical protein
MLSAGWNEMARMEVQGQMHGYPDLVILAGLPVQMFLVTSGLRRLQESKVRALGIVPLFAEIHIDAIDEPDRKGKRRIFESEGGRSAGGGRQPRFGDRSRKPAGDYDRAGAATGGAPRIEGGASHPRSAGVGAALGVP